ncbi:MAG: T9SS type A sorting domain-containing protein [Bacteroidetes bacterium]|nr:T9SS type A sorting domain-containing protein [Bacteroidota bacterium]
MKRFYLFTVICLFSFRFFSQTILTNGMVYNYFVGDTIEYYIQANASPFISYTITFTQKTIKADTLLYQVKEQYYQPPSCMTCSASAGINTYSYQVTDLNSNAIHFALTNTVCTIQYDSSYANGCGQVGLFYNYMYGQDPNHYMNTKTLTYYHKVGQPPCGANRMVMGLTSISSLSAISVYPNPSSQEKIYIDNANRLKLFISIMAPDGKLVYQAESSEKLTEIHKELATGIYFMKLQNVNGESLIKKLIIQ